MPACLQESEGEREREREGEREEEVGEQTAMMCAVVAMNIWRHAHHPNTMIIACCLLYL